MSFYGSVNVPMWVAWVALVILAAHVVLGIARITLRVLLMRRHEAKARELAARYAKRGLRPEEYR